MKPASLFSASACRAKRPDELAPVNEATAADTVRDISRGINPGAGWIRKQDEHIVLLAVVQIR